MVRPIALLVLALTLIAPGAGALTAEGSPDFAAGDEWRYEGSGESQYGTTEATQHTRVTGFDELTLDSGTYDAVVLETTMVATISSDAFTMRSFTNSTTWLTREGHAALRSESETNTVGGPGGDFGSSSTTTYAAPCPTYDWPFTVGDSWTFECKATTRSDGGSQEHSETQELSVLREETIEVPAGTFETLVMRNGSADEAEDGGSRQFYAVDACGPVKMTFEGGGTGFTLELLSFRCGDAQRGDAPTDDPDDGDGPSNGGDGAGGDEPSDAPGAGLVALLTALSLAARVVRRRA